MNIIVYCNSDQHKQQDYTTDSYNSNFENDLNIAIASIEIEKDHINSGYIYSNINNRRQNLTFQHLSAIGNIKAQVPIPDPPRSNIITFCINDQSILLNNKKDLHYFAFAFSCLFLFKTGGYLE